MIKTPILLGLAALLAAAPCAPAALSLYVIDGSANSVFTANLDGSGLSTVTTFAPFSVPFGLTASGSNLYWSMQANPQIQSYNLSTGTTTAPLIAADNPYGIAATGSALYWVDANDDSLFRAGLDGSNKTTLITQAALPHGDSIQNPSGIAVTDSAIYWSDVSAHEILKANLDGSGVQLLVSDPSVTAVNLAVTATNIYWTDQNGAIKRSNLDGTNVVDVISGLTFPAGIALTDSLIYWSDSGAGTVQSIGINTVNAPASAATTVIASGSGLQSPAGLVIATPVPEPATLILASVGIGFVLFCTSRRRRV
jgi:hypothetical protein